MFIKAQQYVKLKWHNIIKIIMLNIAQWDLNNQHHNSTQAQHQPIQSSTTLARYYYY
jgi:hypothetical protein